MRGGGGGSLGECMITCATLFPVCTRFWVRVDRQRDATGCRHDVTLLRHLTQAFVIACSLIRVSRSWLGFSGAAGPTISAVNAAVESGFTANRWGPLCSQSTQQTEARRPRIPHIHCTQHRRFGCRCCWFPSRSGGEVRRPFRPADAGAGVPRSEVPAPRAQPMSRVRTRDTLPERHEADRRQ